MGQNSMKQEDLRIQKTRDLLQQAVFALTVEKGFAAVTVRDIAQRARVNRSTFYRHYLDKHDLLRQYLDALEAEIVQAAAAPASDAVPAGLFLLIKQVQAHADFFRIMLGENGDQAFTHRFRQLAQNRYRLLFERVGSASDPTAPPIEMTLSYISYAGVGAILWWLEHQQPSSPEALAQWLRELNMNAAGLERAVQADRPLPSLSDRS